MQNLQLNKCWGILAEDYCNGGGCLVDVNCSDPLAFYFERVPFGADSPQKYFFSVLGYESQCVTQDEMFGGFLYIDYCEYSLNQLFTVSASAGLVETWSGSGKCIADNCYMPSATPGPLPPTLTTCVCDGSQAQSWTLPPVGDIGTVLNALGQCWNWRKSSECDGLCIVLGSCGDPTAQFMRHAASPPAPGTASWFTTYPPTDTQYCFQQNQ